METTSVMQENQIWSELKIHPLLRRVFATLRSITITIEAGYSVARFFSF